MKSLVDGFKGSFCYKVCGFTCLCDHIISLLTFFREATLSTLIASAFISLYNPHAAGKKNNFPNLSKQKRESKGKLLKSVILSFKIQSISKLRPHNTTETRSPGQTTLVSNTHCEASEGFIAASISALGKAYGCHACISRA